MAQEYLDARLEAFAREHNLYAVSMNLNYRQEENARFSITAHTQHGKVEFGYGPTVELAMDDCERNLA